MSRPLPGASELVAGFVDPPPGYGPVPFWWWVGGRLDPVRLCRQLDQLREKGIMAAVVSYNHHADGTTNVGDPAIFSDAWWAIFRTVLDHARAHGMTLGIQDYCLLKPRLAALGEAEPALRGSALRHVAGRAAPERPCTLEWDAAATVLEATAWADGVTIDIAPAIVGNGLSWQPADGTWHVAVVLALSTPFDPLQPQSGIRSLGVFQEIIAAGIGDHLGTTLTMFFQDELDFGMRWPFWNAALPAVFEQRKGYPLAGRLAELWCDRGPATTKLRVDFADVAVSLLEEHYFAPVHDWHERHGCLFGHDNAGRGAIAVGREYYGDYMRAMRWYSAPGSDDPDLRGPRAFKGLKIAGSIATLQDRPRVWAECFHSSGWGATPAAMLDGVNGVFALGATLINLHGLYYTTAESWWEWAPPDFHFRQPYWACMDRFNAYATRLSWLLAQGQGGAEIAVLYPASALAGGLNPEVDPALAGPIPLSEAQRDEPHPPVDAAEAAAFAIARTLFDDGVDCDFIDDAALCGAVLDHGWLRAGKGRWHTIVLPEMTTIRWETLCRLHAFAAAGGRVVACGALPVASDRQGREDAELDGLVAALFGPGGTGSRIALGNPALAACLAPVHRRAIIVEGGRIQALRRRAEDCDVWFLRNPSDDPLHLCVRWRNGASVSRLDPFDGTIRSLATTQRADGWLEVQAHLPAGSATTLVVGVQPLGPPADPVVPEALLKVLDSGWTYALQPTMNNAFGDFASADRIVGAAVHRLAWCEGEAPADRAEDWLTIAPGHAPRLRLLGPVRDAVDPAWESRVAKAAPGEEPPLLAGADEALPWRDYVVSRREGLLDDPFLRHWSSGPHGLKNAIPDDFIDLEGRPGDAWYLTGIVASDDPQRNTLVAASRSAYRLWLGGTARFEQPKALSPGKLPEWGLPHYDAPLHETGLSPGDNRLLLRLTSPADQRLRARFGLGGTPAPTLRALRWFADGRFALRPGGPERRRPQWFRFAVPPGQTVLEIRHAGKIAGWRDGAAMDVQTLEPGVSRLVAATSAGQVGSVTLQVIAPAQVRAGDCLLGPVRLIEPTGPIACRDWSVQGLAGYSGGVVHRTSFDLDEAAAAAGPVLDTGPIGAVAQVLLNGIALGDIIGPPWRIALSSAAKVGSNDLELRVFNTLANHYAAATPSPYVFEGQTASGLLQAAKIYVKQ